MDHATRPGLRWVKGPGAGVPISDGGMKKLGLRLEESTAPSYCARRPLLQFDFPRAFFIRDPRLAPPGFVGPASRENRTADRRYDCSNLRGMFRR